MIPNDVRPAPMGSESRIDLAESPVKSIHIANTVKQASIESQNTYPSYERWKVSFHDLLDDDEGYRTFYEFLEKERLDILLKCWRSCVQYKKHPPNKPEAKQVYTHFVKIKDSRVPISDQARNNLKLRLNANDVTEDLLSEIENEVFGNLHGICYPKFLKSDFFTFYCETSGQLHYEPSDYYKFGKPSSNVGGHPPMPCRQRLKGNHHPSDDSQPSSLTPNEREVPALAASSYNHSEIQSAFSDASMPYSRSSRGSAGRHERVSHCHHDQPLEPVNFKPRTANPVPGMKQMSPRDFAAELTKQLEKVIQDRELEGGTFDNNNHIFHIPDHMETLPHKKSYSTQPQHRAPIDYYPSETESSMMPPAHERYSVAGQSSHSGSGVNIENSKYKKLKEKAAKDLQNAVHHQLRYKLGECKYDSCFHGRYTSAPQYTSENHSDCCRIRTPLQQQCRCASKDGSSGTPQNVSDHINYPDMIPHGTDFHPETEQQQNKIVAWLQENEKYKHNVPAPSPSLRRKKPQVVYNSSRTGIAVQPIAQDPGMPLLPQPDTGNVLEEVKRVLEEPNQHRVPAMRKLPMHHGAQPPTHHYYNDQQPSYNDYSYDRAGSMASGNWPFPDSASMVSFNPSTVPSSASRYWNEQGYMDSSYDVRYDHRSEARSHSTGRHSGVCGSVTRSTRTNVSGSDVKSQSTGRSHGSDNSRDLTTIKYLFWGEPIPYLIKIPSKEVTLAQFKAETKKGNFRYYFKTISEDDGKDVYEEVKYDDEVLPRYKGTIIGKIEKIE